MVVLDAIRILDYITIEDAIGSVKIHNSTLIKTQTNHNRESSYI